MKILLSNKFYYRRGGDCVCTLNTEQLLKAHGHEVAVFAMDYPENLDTPWNRYFPQNMSKLMAFTRPFGSREVRRKFNALLDDFCPEVVHLNNIHTCCRRSLLNWLIGVTCGWCGRCTTTSRFARVLDGRDVCKACFSDKRPSLLVAA